MDYLQNNSDHNQIEKDKIKSINQYDENIQLKTNSNTKIYQWNSN